MSKNFNAAVFMFEGWFWGGLFGSGYCYCAEPTVGLGGECLVPLRTEGRAGGAQVACALYRERGGLAGFEVSERRK